jgi:2-hydroxy-3-keto-5-methylthiopentenyl-1-phosphate phosphatase
MKFVPEELVLFSDFDGTVSIGDVGNRLFHHFSRGRSEEPVSRWLEGKIDSRQCLIEEAALMEDVTVEEINDFIDSYEIDPYFSPFVELVRDRGIPLYILSDGLDLYIHRLLTQNGLDHVPFFSNRAELNSGRLHFSWPYYDQSCGGCANCKGYQIRRLRRPGQKAIYIGDGKSDLCALPEADLIFAKGYLAEHCRRSGLDFYAYEDFKAVRERIQELLID